MTAPNPQEGFPTIEQCPQCGHQNPNGQKYCGECGAKLLTAAPLPWDEAIRAQVRKVIKEEFADEKLVEIETTEKVLNRINRWAKLLGYYAGIPLGIVILLLTFLGIKKFTDLWELSSAAEKTIQPMIDAAQEKAKEVDRQTKDLGSKTNDVQERLKSLQPKLAEIEAGSQKLAELRAKVEQSLTKQASLDTKLAGLEGDVSEIRNVIANSSNYTKGRNGYHPEAIVIHTMEGTLAGAEKVFQDTGIHASAHYGVGKDGSVVRFVPEEDMAFHAGIIDRPTWSLLKQGVNPNLYTIGIEHEGKSEDIWTPQMYAASAKLIAQAARRWGFPIDRQHIIGHSEIQRTKRCPGPGVDLDRLVRLAKQQADSLSK